MFQQLWSNAANLRLADSMGARLSCCNLASSISRKRGNNTCAQGMPRATTRRQGGSPTRKIAYTTALGATMQWQTLKAA